TDALVCSWPRGLRKYAFPPVSLIAQTLCKVREDKEQILLVAPFWPNRTWFSELMLLSSIPPWCIPLSMDFLSQEKGTIWHPRPDLWNLHLWTSETFHLQRLYNLKWCIFVNWCASQREGSMEMWHQISAILPPRRHLSASTLKVQVAAISANYDLVEGRSVGKHNLVIRFLRGARRLNPPRLCLIPSWDLSVVLQALQQDPFEPLQSVDLSALSMKTAVLTALTSVKRVRDLQVLSINDSCLEFEPADSHIILRPQPGYMPK
ncbi:hypothetical protein M9458_010246, partial [Cirrhinus mrigala]